jgi:hypothetical protein
MINENYRVPAWLLQKVGKHNQVLAMSIDTPIRLHKFSKSPPLKVHHFRAPSYDITKKYKHLKSSYNKPAESPFDKNLSKNYIKKHSSSNRTEAFLSMHKKKLRADVLSVENKDAKYEPRVSSLPPLKNSLARSIADNSLVSNPRVDCDLSEEGAEWNNTESEEDGKNLQEYLREYNYIQ